MACIAVYVVCVVYRYVYTYITYRYIERDEHHMLGAGGGGPVGILYVDVCSYIVFSILYGYFVLHYSISIVCYIVLRCIML